MPCNSAHFFLDRLAADTGLNFVNMVHETVRELAASGSLTVGLLGTRATLRSGLYQAPLAETGMGALLPTEDEQALVDMAIAQVKAGEADSARPLIERAASALTKRGAQAIVLACTELPIAMQGSVARDQAPIVDPTDVLARAVVRECSRAA